MTETVSERRLRELADVMVGSWTCEGKSNQPDLDAMRHGADALKLWREYLHHMDNARTADNMWTETAAYLKAQESEAAARALLAQADQE